MFLGGTWVIRENSKGLKKLNFVEMLEKDGFKKPIFRRERFQMFVLWLLKVFCWFKKKSVIPQELVPVLRRDPDSEDSLPVLEGFSQIEALFVTWIAET